jgi:6-phosphogluconolactonase
MIHLQTFDTAQQCASALASAFAETLRARLRDAGSASMALSGGRSPRAVLSELGSADIRWHDVFLTLIDDRWVPPDHPDSNERLVQETLFATGAGGATFIPLWSDHATPDDGIAAANTALRQLPMPIDITHLGLGDDGHIASLFPGDDASIYDAETGYCVTGTASVEPRMRISLTLATLLQSRVIYLHFNGSEKRRIYERAITEHPSPQLPLSLIMQSDHPDIRVFISD